MYVHVYIYIFTLHRIAPHYIALHHITSHHVTSHHIYVKRTKKICNQLPVQLALS